MTLKYLAAAGAVAVLAALPASAAIITIDFEGVGDGQQVGNFYNGGAGTNYGIGFSPGSLGIVDSDAGGGGNIGNEPSPSTVLYFLDSTSAIMNVAAGFNIGFSFFYTSVSFAGSVNVYDALNGTGNLLGSLNLAALGAGPGDPNGTFSNWAAIGVLFAGTAKSVDFGGVANQIAFDNITLGTDKPGTSPVPIPATLPLLAGALGLVGMLRRRKTL